MRIAFSMPAVSLPITAEPGNGLSDQRAEAMGLARLVAERTNFARYCGMIARSHFQDDRHDQRPPGRFLHDIPLQIRADLLFDYAPVGLLLAVGGFQRFRHYLAGR